MKCKHSSGSLTDKPQDLKIIRFRIEIVPDVEDTSKLRIQFVHSGGNINI
jgi:hypothetical protein